MSNINQIIKFFEKKNINIKKLHKNTLFLCSLDEDELDKKKKISIRQYVGMKSVWSSCDYILLGNKQKSGRLLLVLIEKTDMLPSARDYFKKLKENPYKKFKGAAKDLLEDYLPNSNERNEVVKEIDKIIIKTLVPDELNTKNIERFIKKCQNPLRKIPVPKQDYRDLIKKLRQIIQETIVAHRVFKENSRKLRDSLHMLSRLRCDRVCSDLMKKDFEYHFLIWDTPNKTNKTRSNLSSIRRSPELKNYLYDEVEDLLKKEIEHLGKSNGNKNSLVIKYGGIKNNPEEIANYYLNN